MRRLIIWFIIDTNIFIIVIVIRTIVYGDPVSGWPSLVSIVLLVGGMQLFALGIIGQYIGKIYLETKKRPSYIIKEMKWFWIENKVQGIGLSTSSILLSIY